MPTISTDALVLVDKPVGITSFDAVRAVTRAIGTRKAGHAGTLDPFATGLLIILTGRGTRLLRFVNGEPKVYLATIRFGEERDTDDRTGDVTRQAALPSTQDVLETLPRFEGIIAQVPPAYSAKKIDGRRAYALARRGDAPTLPPVDVRVDRWEPLHVQADTLVARITCGGGTYIRALARDLGRAVGSAAYLESLRRERCGAFHVEDAVPWEALKAGDARPRPLGDALGDTIREQLESDDVARVGHGMTVLARTDGPRAVLVDAEGQLLAIARREADRWQPEVVLSHA
ncbi:MAG: tRNA pseudouridine(55) synthase TruB [Gemmatimonadaceae bacterium]|nr:tRNA pseudouridine(55) synthase TruB [Gemmatimonadaceae bacterium]